MNRKRLHLHITGIVQGVCYRAYAKDEALRLGLTGWVANRSDGSVELVAEGRMEALDLLAAWCEEGPPSASVCSVEREWGEATGEFQRFLITR
jgi:acylphosphatase